MSKPANPRSKPPAATKPARAPARNSRLGAQTRKLLTKHYRAKHGVR
jgi:hypothetical protein